MEYIVLLWVLAFMWVFHYIAKDIHEAVEQEEEIEESEDYDGKSKEPEDKEEIS